MPFVFLYTDEIQTRERELVLGVESPSLKKVSLCGEVSGRSSACHPVKGSYETELGSGSDEQAAVRTLVSPFPFTICRHLRKEEMDREVNLL